jgi:hypothetical protein
MGRCSSCGVDLSGYGELCPKCYAAQDAALIPQKDSSRHGWFSYMHVLLWIIYLLFACHLHTSFRNGNRSFSRLRGHILSFSLGLFEKTEEEI